MTTVPDMTVVRFECRDAGSVVGFFSRKSLQVQLIALGAVAITVMSLAAGVVVVTTWLQAGPSAAHTLETITLRFLVTLIVAGLVSLILIALGVRRVLSPLHRLRESMIDVAAGRSIEKQDLSPRSWDLLAVQDAYRQLVDRIDVVQAEHVRSQRVLKGRTQTVDRLLDFSQTIQGAGKRDQVFAALSHYLRTELDLAGIVVLAHEPDAVPSTQVRTSWPLNVLREESPITEMDTSLCPCLRQNLPKCFKPDGSPVRCAVDESLTLSADHAAYCIPFTVGRVTQVLVHMLLQTGTAWNEDTRQLAQTYVNAAHSALISLHMLAEAEQQSMTDALTGLYNRRSLDQLMEREVALSERHGHPLSIVMIDMDKFKEVNDSHGHAAGDHMLKQFADCVRITLRKTDLAFRFGGDEFMIALPQTGIAQAQQVVNKLRQAYATVDFDDAIANLDHQPTLSIGVAERSKSLGVLTLPQILAAADQALYDAKASNRNCVRVYQSTRAA